MTERNCSGVSRVAGTAVPTPALLTRMSTRPYAAIVSSTRCWQACGSVTSVATAIARRPSPSTMAAVSASLSARRAPRATSAPASARAWAKVTPSPLEAPVTTATLPSRRNRSSTAMSAPFERVGESDHAHGVEVLLGEVREHDQVLQLTTPVPEVVPQEGLAGEAQGEEHVDGAFLGGRELDDDLHQTVANGGGEGVQREPAAETLAPDCRVGHEPELCDMVGPAGEQHEGREAGDRAVAGDTDPPSARLVEPAGDGVRRHVLLDEGEVARGQAGEEVDESRNVARTQIGDAHEMTSLRLRRNSMMVGMVRLAAVRPTMRPTWPASRRSSVLSGEPTRPISGAAAASGMMWSRSPRTCRNGSRMSDRCTWSPPRNTRSLTTALSAIIRLSCRATPPGRGTCSVAQPVIAWYAVTNSSFHIFSKRSTLAVTSPTGASVRKPCSTTDAGTMPSSSMTSSRSDLPMMSLIGPSWVRSAGVVSTVRLRSGDSGWCAAWSTDIRPPKQ